MGLGRTAVGCGLGGCLGVALLVMVLFWMGSSALRSSRQPSPTPVPPRETATKAEDAGSTKRLVREDLRPDDGARAFIFRSALRQSGQRCDEVQSAHMGAPGVWTIRCSPGYSYRFTFDSNGKMLKAFRLE